MVRVLHLNVGIPAQLRERARAVASELGIDTKALICLALRKEVEAFEDKLEQERQKKAAERELQQRERERRRSGVILDLSTTPAPRDPDDALYEHHAQRIFEAQGDVREEHVRRLEAVAAIKKRSPVTCPPDDVIRERLDRLAATLRPREQPQNSAETVISLGDDQQRGEPA
jgi:antitoxin component of RelBE/YafQ-DinJ toxin-antitoxin module